MVSPTDAIAGCVCSAPYPPSCTAQRLAMSLLIAFQVIRHRARVVPLQGRSFELVYFQYFTEHFHNFKTAVAMAEALGATDVLMNAGVWLRDEAAGSEKLPDVPWICELFAQEQSYNTLWIGTAPSVAGGRVVITVPPGHPMHVQSACGLPPEQVVDRAAVLQALEPDEADRVTLWWTSDGPHFHADANHGFNQALLHKLGMPTAALGRRWLPFS